jgi:hypothetical protein
MAKRKTAHAKTQIVRMTTPRPVAPIIRVSAPRAPTHHKKKGHHGRRRGHSKGNLQKRMMAVALGGLAWGFLEKHLPATLPTVPVIGKTGTVALAAYLLVDKMHVKIPYLEDIAMATAVLAAYEYGSTGKVAGDFDAVHGSVMGGVASQF